MARVVLLLLSLLHLGQATNCQEDNCPTVDCEVGDWKPWGECSATCGGGTKTRAREVVEEPQNGGATCPALEETIVCNTEGCPVDCEVGDWKQWGECSVTCGGDGTRTKAREVVKEPENGGASCPELEETEVCITDKCKAVPEEIDLCQWTDWTSCNFFCGTPRLPQKTREKASEGSDGDCRKDLDTSEDISTEVEKEDCDADQQCTTPFIFGPWISTPYCNASCGTNRFKLELRTCTPISPNLPANISCQNETTLKAGNSTCININCTGDVEQWSSWSDCEANCSQSLQAYRSLVYAILICKLHPAAPSYLVYALLCSMASVSLNAVQCTFVEAR